MKFFSGKLDLLTLFAVVLMAISISYLDFTDLSWSRNSASYLGLLLFLAVVIVRLLSKRQAGESK